MLNATSKGSSVASWSSKSPSKLVQLALPAGILPSKNVCVKAAAKARDEKKMQIKLKIF